MPDSTSGDLMECPSSGAEAQNRPIRLDTRTIFREMIARELRSGRLTAAQRARFVRYAAQMGLSATQAGLLIAECRDEALQSGDGEIREFALRLVEPVEPLIPTWFKIAVVIVAALTLDVLIVLWIW